VIQTAFYQQQVAIIFTVIAFIAAVALLLIYLQMLRRVRRGCRSSEYNDDGGDIPVSVVVYTYANATGLAQVVETLRTQKYGAPYEIIVVNDGDDTAVDDYLTITGTIERRLRHTFTPHDTRNISRKKLALTLGIKAAQHPVVLLLTSESRPAGEQWLSAMAAPFRNRNIEIVLGYAGPGDADISEKRINRRLRNNLLLGDIHWLSDAIGGNAWRGDGDNMGMRRSLFFDQMGYGNSLNLQYGDDDVFVSEAATEINTAVVLDPCAHATTQAPVETPNYYKMKRERHLLMSPYCTRRPRLNFFLEAITVWLWLLASIGACVCTLWNPIAAIAPDALPLTCTLIGIVLLIALAMWITLAVKFNSVSMALTKCKLRLNVLGMLLMHPLRSICLHKKAPRSWQQPL
jgi:glycosyltransferase involved in cell wall biosynthesis